MLLFFLVSIRTVSFGCSQEVYSTSLYMLSRYNPTTNVNIAIKPASAPSMMRISSVITTIPSLLKANVLRTRPVQNLYLRWICATSQFRLRHLLADILVGLSAVERPGGRFLPIYAGGTRYHFYPIFNSSLIFIRSLPSMFSTSIPS